MLTLESWEQTEWNNMMSEIDAEGRGKIQFPEAVELLQSLPRVRMYTDDQIREAFRSFDPEGSGFVTVAEMKRVLSYVAPDREVKDMLDAVDEDRSGVINYRDFIHRFWNDGEEE